MGDLPVTFFCISTFPKWIYTISVIRETRKQAQESGCLDSHSKRRHSKTQHPWAWGLSTLSLNFLLHQAGLKTVTITTLLWRLHFTMYVDHNKCSRTRSIILTLMQQYPPPNFCNRRGFVWAYAYARQKAEVFNGCTPKMLTIHIHSLSSLS